MKKINPRIIVVVIAAIIIIAIVIFMVFFPLRKKSTETTETISSSLSSSGTSTETTSTSPNLNGSPPPDEDIKGVDTITALDTMLNKLPLIKDNFSLFYDGVNKNFIANINAKEGTAEAKSAIDEINKLFVDQGVKMSEISIDYIYR